MNQLQNLIDRLEFIRGSNREIDARIWAELDSRDVREDELLLLARSRIPPHDECVLGYFDNNRRFLTEIQNPPLPHYTKSIDDALKLMPELTDKIRPLKIIFGFSESGQRFACAIENWQWGYISINVRSNLPIALCIALLKVRKEIEHVCRTD